MLTLSKFQLTGSPSFLMPSKYFKDLLQKALQIFENFNELISPETPENFSFSNVLKGNNTQPNLLKLQAKI